MMHLFDPGPVLECQGALSDVEFAAQLGVTRRTVVRWRGGQQLIANRAVADRHAVNLGHHPGELWPEWWTA